MKSFTINGKEYKARELDFNAVCDMEDDGVSVTNIETKSMSFIRAYFALCSKKGKKFAGEEIQQHCINGGNLEELIEVVGKAVEESDFFQSLTKTAETDNQENAEASGE